MKKRVSIRDDLATMRKRYLDLLETVLVGSIYSDPPLATFGQTQYNERIRSLGEDWPSRAYSMIGNKRMHNFRHLVEKAILDKIPGDIVETGVWRGGACIMARAVLAAYNITNRKVILADSFEGLPPPDIESYQKDEGSTFHQFKELAVGLEEVKGNFSKFGLLDRQVVMQKGWFKETMPKIKSRRIAVLRLDGDMYESTIIPLRALFDKVADGGWVIVDDYNCVPACKSAVDHFLSERKLKPKIVKIDKIGVYFQKSIP